MKSNRILPCGVSSAPSARRLGRHLVEVAGDEPVEKSLGVLARHPHDAAVAEDARSAFAAPVALACAVTYAPAGRPQGPAPHGRAAERELAMPQTFDLVLKGGTVVNQDGRAERDVGVIGGAIAALGDLSRASAERDRRLPRPAHPAGRHRHAGAFPRARPRPQGRPRKRFPRRRPGRRHGGLRDAEHRAADDDARPPSPTRSGAARHRMHCDFAFWVGGTHENAAEVAALERLPAAAGIKVFMGSSTGSLLVEDDAGLAEILSPHAPPRRLPFGGRDDAARPPRPARRRRSALASGLALAGGGARLHAAPRARSRGRPARASTCCTSRPRRRWRFLARAQGCRVRRSDAASSHPRRAGLLRTPRHAGADEPAGARRRASRRRSGRASTKASPTSSAPTTRRIPSRKRRRTIRTTPSGMTGVQTLVPIMLDHVNASRLTLERFVDMTSAGPKRLFGIAKKGRIAAGYDADFTIVDLQPRRDDPQRAGSPRNPAGRPMTASP